MSRECEDNRVPEGRHKNFIFQVMREQGGRWLPGVGKNKKSKNMALVEELKTKAAAMNPGKKEGRVAKAIEEQTAKLPSDLFLWTAVGCMTASLTLKVLKQDHLALFIGQWVPSFLLLGIYNKIVKVEGHDREDKAGVAFG